MPQMKWNESTPMFVIRWRCLRTGLSASSDIQRSIRNGVITPHRERWTSASPVCSNSHGSDQASPRKGQVLALDGARVTCRQGFVDSSGPPVVDADAEHRGAELDPGVVVEKVPVERLVEQLVDLCPHIRHNRDAEFARSRVSACGSRGPTRRARRGLPPQRALSSPKPSLTLATRWAARTATAPRRPRRETCFPESSNA